MTGTYFQGNKEHPQHISVGAVLLNNNSEICCHHIHTKDLKGYWSSQVEGDFYILMRETINPNESLEDGLHRGLVEEFGATAKLLDYLGSIESKFKDAEVEVQKTTLYFLCELISMDKSRRSTGDVEGASEMEWHKSEFLIPIMREQAAKFGRTDLDESPILERYLKTQK